MDKVQEDSPKDAIDTLLLYLEVHITSIALHSAYPKSEHGKDLVNKTRRDLKQVLTQALQAYK